MLAAEINTRVNSRTMLPQSVKASFSSALSSGRTIPAVIRPLTSWVVGAMPAIAQYHGIRPDQVIDSLQHYRFGFVQAKRLLDAKKTEKFSQGIYGPYEEDLIALFESVHDLGRMMVGSAATRDMFSDKNEGNMLHPIVGAMMLREASSSVTFRVSPLVSGLVRALIATAERHTLSIGLPASAVAAFGLDQISPWYSSGGSLWLKDGDMPEIYKKYAHLIAFADLINNVSEKLSGTSEYLSTVKLESMDTQQRADYIVNGPGIGAFQVRKPEEASYTGVERLWRDSKPLDPQSFDDCLALMRQTAVKFLSGAEKAEGEAAFDAGVEEVF